MTVAVGGLPGLIAEAARELVGHESRRPGLYTDVGASVGMVCHRIAANVSTGLSPAEAVTRALLGAS